MTNNLRSYASTAPITKPRIALVGSDMLFKSATLDLVYNKLSIDWDYSQVDTTPYAYSLASEKL